MSGRERVDALEPPDRVSTDHWVSEATATAHAKAVAEAKEEILAGWTYQVNLTMRFRAEAPAEPFSLYRHLACSQRGAYNAFLEEDRFAICCASPELFFERDARSVRSRPMKGTAPRGRFAEEDQAAAAALLASEKERAENVMILDLIRNDLGRLAEYGSVTVPELFVLERYPTLWQMTSEVHARVPTCTTLGEVFAALFPCGSVTGAPKNSTMEVISRLESSPRGVYSVPSGHSCQARTVPMPASRSRSGPRRWTRPSGRPPMALAAESRSTRMPQPNAGRQP